MMELKVTSPSMPGGWDYYCGGCDLFFSVPANQPVEIKHCPACGWDTLIKSPEEFEEDYPNYQFRRAS